MSKANEQNIALVAKYREAVQAGDVCTQRRVSETLLRLNEGLVKKFGLTFGRPQTADEKEDVFQAARLGILRSLQDYDPQKGAFSTYAQWHIRDYVQRWTGKTVAVTRPRSASMPARVAKAAREFRQKHGREPSAEDLGVSPEKFAEWSSATHFVEIDANPDDERHVELTYDPREAEHVGARLDLRNAWESAVKNLSPRNTEIAYAFFFERMSLQEIAAEHGLVHQRISQICKRVEIRLRRVLFPEATLVDRTKLARKAFEMRKKGLAKARPRMVPVVEEIVPSVQESA